MKKRANDDPRELRDLLLRLIDEAWSRTGWTDRSLRRSLRGVGPPDAARRPGPTRPSVHETVVHLAYWKHVLARRIAGEEDVAFPEAGRDWFPRPGVDPTGWARDLRLLREKQERLRDVVDRADPRSEKVVSYVVGAAFHDMYHAAQIELTRRLAAETQPVRARQPA